MSDTLFHLDEWQALSDAERLVAAQKLAERLPRGFAFSGLETHRAGSQSHCVAFFNWNRSGEPTARFALIPGGVCVLGYDREHPFVPTPVQQESWLDTQEIYDVPDLLSYIDEIMTPRRTVLLHPVLLETKLPGNRFGEETPARDWSNEFRLPTSDEWEWACGAGAQTLWRWGNDCPMDGYPSDYRRNNPGWNLHQQPNAFGLSIADDDYHLERCEGNILRGGDGGVSTCGGAGFLLAWLTLASAYAVPQEQTKDLDEFSQYRRVFPLSLL